MKRRGCAAGLRAGLLSSSRTTTCCSFSASSSVSMRRGILSSSLGDHSGYWQGGGAFNLVPPHRINSSGRELKECCARASSCSQFASGRCNGFTTRCCATAKPEQHEHTHDHLHDHSHECHPKFGSSPKCWSCERFLIKSSLFCSACHKVQPLHEYNSFEVLGMPKEFNIDLKLLEKHYWALQRRVHPDLFHQKSKLEKDYSALVSSHLNEAYNTLKHPDTRARYMLKMQGINIDEELRIDNPELLMEVMEVRSEIEEAESQEALKQLQKQNNEKLDNYYKGLGEAFGKKDFEEAKRLVAELQYFIRVRDEIRNKLH